MSIQIETTIAKGAWPDADIIENWIANAINCACECMKFSDISTELSVLLTDDAEIKSLNAKWRGHDKTTNVLSFPALNIEIGHSPGPILGDIVMGYETAKKESEIEEKPFEHHFTHLIIHGFLHLVGYDHENNIDAEKMENLETVILAAMGIKDPYATNSAGD